MKKHFTLFLIVFFLFTEVYAQKTIPAFLKTDDHWVDSVMTKLSLDEKIGQLFMIAAYSDGNKKHETDIIQHIQKNKIGGLIFLQGSAEKQAESTNQYQALARVPLLIAIDAEWGLGMAFYNTMKFPYQMALGAIQGDSLIYLMGSEIARQMKRLGVHINFAPVVDINNNSANPVINVRSFGESKSLVTTRGLAYMRGMQDNSILAVAKHFPGHGNTNLDSHKTLPVINQSYSGLDSLELFPFKQLINNGVGGVMTGHLSVPALDTSKNVPSSLSKPIVTDLLKKKLGFEGLVFTDALNMKGVTSFFPKGKAELTALLAGNDVLVFTENTEIAIEEIKQALISGILKEETINEKCRKILKLKVWCGLKNYSPVKLDNLLSDLNTAKAEVLNRKLIESSLTLLRNKNSLIPLDNLENLKIAALSLGCDTISAFQKMLSNYMAIDYYNLSTTPKTDEIEKLKFRLKKYNLVIAGIHNVKRNPKDNYGINTGLIELITALADSNNTIVTFFGNPYAMAQIKDLDKANGLIVAYQESTETQELCAQLIFGAIGAHGKLPVTVSPAFPFGAGIYTSGGWRFKYTLPEELGLDGNFISYKIDSIMNTGISKKAFPGGVVFAAKDGKVFFHKAYGYHTYDNSTPVQLNDLYDFASVTKISTGLPCYMKLYDEGKFNPDDKISKYFKEFRHSNKKDMIFRDVLTHQARLKEWIPFWKNAIKKDGTYRRNTFKNDSSRRFSIKVADRLYLNRKYYKTMYKAIKDSPLLEKKKYVYSDLSFILAPPIISRITHSDFEAYIKSTFYKPLGASTLTFNPSKFYPLSRIVPTENDTFFRKQQIHGRVHDEGAAMLDGVSGHAGLFGTASDLGKLMQMYLQKGQYGNTRYIKESTVNEFIRCQFCDQGNRRGLGFDKPLIDHKDKGTPSKDASDASFGHTGFTGTFTWADPKNGLLLVFFSNRVYPTRNNNKLSDLNIRPSVHQVLYDALKQAQIK